MDGWMDGWMALRANDLLCRASLIPVLPPPPLWTQAAVMRPNGKTENKLRLILGAAFGGGGCGPRRVRLQSTVGPWA